jgi:type IV pilus assembly protein PilV
MPTLIRNQLSSKKLSPKQLSPKKLSPKKLSPKKRQHGVSMIEVLIAMVLLITTLLGATALQITGLQTNRSAYYRSQASIIAYDITDRIRLNASYARGDNDRYSIDTSDKLTPTLTGCMSDLNGCSPEKVRRVDVLEWSEFFFDVTGIGHDGSNYRPLLPGGVGVVSVSGAKVSVQISWQEVDWNVGAGTNKADTTKQLSLDFNISG